MVRGARRTSRVARWSGRCAACAAALLLAARPAAGQLVGHEPDRSPYTDVAPTQQLSLLTGWFLAGSEPAGVAIGNAPFAMLRHDIAIGGPAWLTSRYALVVGERDVLDPTANADARVVERRASALHVADIGLSLALTGRKAYKRFVPTLQGGIGLTSDFAGTDAGGYGFGTRFAFSYGFGMRYVLRNRWSVRADVSNWLFQYQYPNQYFVPAADSTAVLPTSAGRSSWAGNWGLSVGLSAPLGRR